MRLILAEKPSVAADIAKALGSAQRREGYFQVGQDVVTYAIGHLLSARSLSTLIPKPLSFQFIESPATCARVHSFYKPIWTALYTRLNPIKDCNSSFLSPTLVAYPKPTSSYPLAAYTDSYGELNRHPKHGTLPGWTKELILDTREGSTRIS